MSDVPTIFVSYASPDQRRVLTFYDGLTARGFNLWMDCKSLKPGQIWDFQIKRELARATLVLVFVSHNSVDRRGYAQREIKLALDKLNEKLPDDIYVIPILLDDDVTLPPELEPIHSIKASHGKCIDAVTDAINHQLSRLGVARSGLQKSKRVVWERRTIREAWDGTPGYEVEFEFLHFSSDLYPNITEITEYVKGNLLSNLFRYRQNKLGPQSDSFNLGLDRTLRTDYCDAYSEEPIINGKLISIQQTINWYGAGAAHGNVRFETYNFLLEPLALIETLSQTFQDPEVALSVMQRETRSRFYERDPEGNEWIDNGTSTWDAFRAFIFIKEGVRILFAPYQIAPYAAGPQTVTIPFQDLRPLMRKEYVEALGIPGLD